MSFPQTDPGVGLRGLPDAIAKPAVTSSFLRGDDDLPIERLMQCSVPLTDDIHPWDARFIRELLDETMRRFDGNVTASDAWLSPRLHYALRMSRAEASGTELWNFLALLVAPDFVRWRWGKTKGEEPAVVAQVDRFVGYWAKQCFSRLWWGAELFRNGKNYGSAEKVIASSPDILSTLLRQEIVRHRPTAQALIHHIVAGSWNTGREANALAQAVNTAGSTLMFEVMAPDEPRDADALQDWIKGFEGANLYHWESLPEGPDDGSVPEQSTRTLVELFEKLSAGADVRGRKGSAEVREGD